MNKNTIKLLWGTGGLVVGGTAGYFLTKGFLEKKYAEFADKEIESLHERYRLLRKDGEHSDPTNGVSEEELEDAVEETRRERVNNFKDLAAELGYVPIADAEPDEQPYNIFTNPSPEVREVNRADEEFFAQRNVDEPYVITLDEWNDIDWDKHDKVQLTWFAGDQTLMDDSETVVDEVVAVVGIDALDNFGRGSQDPEIVYVRNPIRGADFEIVKDDRKYLDVVLQDSFDRPEKRGIHKMRSDD